MRNEDFQKEVLQRLTAIETNLSALVGDGKPGRIDQIETDVKQLEAAHNQRRGARHILELGVGFVGGLLGGWLKHHG